MMRHDLLLYPSRWNHIWGEGSNQVNTINLRIKSSSNKKDHYDGLQPLGMEWSHDKDIRICCLLISNAARKAFANGTRKLKVNRRPLVSPIQGHQMKQIFHLSSLLLRIHLSQYAMGTQGRRRSETERERGRADRFWHKPTESTEGTVRCNSTCYSHKCSITVAVTSAVKVTVLPASLSLSLSPLLRND